jgi:hypothetical protein
LPLQQWQLDVVNHFIGVDEMESLGFQSTKLRKKFSDCLIFRNSTDATPAAHVNLIEATRTL